MNKKQSKSWFIGNREMSPLGDADKFRTELTVATEASSFFEQSLELWEPHITKAFESLAQLFPSWNRVKCNSIAYFFDRIIHSTENNIILQSDNPTYAYVDISSINRSTLESAINCICLIKDDDELFLGFLIQAVRDDQLRKDKLKWWCRSENIAISSSAKELILKNKYFTKKHEDQFLNIFRKKSAVKVPSIEKRAKIAGEHWHYLYWARYKQLCQWSHFRLTEVFFSPINRCDVNTETTGVQRGVEMLHFGFHILYLFLLDIYSHQNLNKMPLEKFYEKLMEDFAVILENSSLTKPFKEIDDS